ncbi:MAG: hypothetical protein U0905_14070 [Pirellulales bacterium]
MDRTEHWENVYRTKKATEVSWYEADPIMSLDLIMEVVESPHGHIYRHRGWAIILSGLIGWWKLALLISPFSMFLKQRLQPQVAHRSQRIFYNLDHQRYYNRNSSRFLRCLARSSRFSFPDGPQRSTTLHRFTEGFLAPTRPLHRGYFC